MNPTYSGGLLIRALHLAAHRHHKQYRKGADKTPYINHLIHVVDILINEGLEDDTEVLIAAALHDVIEDTVSSDTEREKLQKHIANLFGQSVLETVNAVTDNKKLEKAEQKRLQVVHAPLLSLQAKKVKLSDKIANLTDIIHNPPRWWPRKIILDYIHWSAEVVNGLRGVHAGMEALFDDTFHNALSKYGQGDGLFIVYAINATQAGTAGFTLHSSQNTAQFFAQNISGSNNSDEPDKIYPVLKVKVTCDIFRKVFDNEHQGVFVADYEVKKYR